MLNVIRLQEGLIRKKLGAEECILFSTMVQVNHHYLLVFLFAQQILLTSTILSQFGITSKI